ncbi:MAG TPA: Ig-like domain-containing protein [Longimicrobium sp.]
MRSFRTSLLLGALFLAAAACENDPTTAGPPAQLDVVSGNDQQGTVGQELAQPLVVKVVDEDGRPVRDQLVNFRVTRGGGTVFAGSAITNRDGLAQERWTMGTVADSQRVEARAVDQETGAALVFATFRAVARAGAAATLSAVQPQMSGQPGTPLADSAAALVRDQHGNPVSGVTVNWAVTSGGGSVSPASSTTSAQGIARARWTLGGALLTPQTLQASAGGSMTASFTATATLGAGAVLARVSGEAQTGPVWTEMAQPLVVELKQNGVPVQGATITWTTSSGTLAGTTGGATTTDAQGRTSVRWTPGGTSGSQTVTAQVQGASVTFTGMVTPGPAVLVSPRGAFEGTFDAGTTLPTVFGVYDAYNNPIAGVALTFSASAGGAVSTPTATTNAQGIANVSWTLPENLGGVSVATARITATAAGIAEPGYRDAGVRAVVTSIVITPDAQTAAPGAWANYTVRLQDSFGNQFGARGYTGCGVGWSAQAPAEVVPQVGLFYPGVNAFSNTPGTYTLTATCGPFSDTATLTVQ